MYDGYLNKLCEDGKDTSEHKPPIEPADIDKLYEKVFVDTPQGLQYRMFYELLMHFGRRGREGLRELRKDTFEVKEDGNGQEYVRITCNELEKAKRGDGKQVKEKKCAMYSRPKLPRDTFQEIPGAPSRLLSPFPAGQT